MIKKAYAKINLGLKVVGKRTDGFHNLETIMTRVSLFDKVEIYESDEIIVECDCIAQEENLVYKIATYMKDEYNVVRGAKIKITKNIPLQAGLGGGSSDAAVAIEGLNEFWGLGLEKCEKEKIANMFGSDINFFLENGASYVTGKGEKVEPFIIKERMNILLVKPKFGISTSEAFSYINEYSKSGELLKVKKTLENGNNLDLKEATNDLEKSLNGLGVLNEINEIKEKLLNGGAHFSLMSGSGSTVFGAFFDLEKLKEMSEVMKAEGYDVYEVYTL